MQASIHFRKPHGERHFDRRQAFDTAFPFLPGLVHDIGLKYGNIVGFQCFERHGFHA